MIFPVLSNEPNAYSYHLLARLVDLVEVWTAASPACGSHEAGTVAWTRVSGLVGVSDQP